MRALLVHQVTPKNIAICKGKKEMYFIPDGALKII